MTVINQEDRKRIARGMMQKTSFKSRFNKELEAIGEKVHARQVADAERQYGDLMAFIREIPREHVGHLCAEHDSARQYVSHSWGDKTPNLYQFFDRKDIAQALFMAGASHRMLSVRFPRSIWLPRNMAASDLSSLWEDGSLGELDRLCRDFLSTEEALTMFLATVRTVKQLHETMPEAMEFVGKKVPPPALILNSANALAALTKAGFFAEAGVPA